jgi:hypothetical protein
MNTHPISSAGELYKCKEILGTPLPANQAISLVDDSGVHRVVLVL